MKTTTIDLFNIFVLTFTVFVTICIISVYDSMKTSYTKRKYSWNPFPTERLEDIPNANVEEVSRCTMKPTKPDPTYGCKMCGPEFKETVVHEGERVMMNGVIVKPGTYCLPQGKDETGCGTYTGRATWSYDPYTGKQGWSCVCLYPDLFGGNECLTQYACRDPTVGGDQTKNVLKNVVTGEVWDPTDPNFTPPITGPYARQTQDDPSPGAPLYECTCDENKGTQGTKFTTMPKDPYRCHKDPCVPELNNEFSGFNKDEEKCHCPGISPTSGNAYVLSNVTGRCHDIGDSCEPSKNWDQKANTCACPNDAEREWLTETCESNTYVRDSYTSDRKCPTNPGGSYCYNPCLPFPCLTKPTTDSSGNKKEGDVCCIVSPDNPDCHPTNPGDDYTCICHEDDTYQYSGQNCDKYCYKDGHTVSDDNKDMCCNGYQTCLLPGGSGDYDYYLKCGSSAAKECGIL